MQKFLTMLLGLFIFFPLANAQVTDDELVSIQNNAESIVQAFIEAATLTGDDQKEFYCQQVKANFDLHAISRGLMAQYGLRAFLRSEEFSENQDQYLSDYSLWVASWLSNHLRNHIAKKLKSETKSEIHISEAKSDGSSIIDLPLYLISKALDNLPLPDALHDPSTEKVIFQYRKVSSGPHKGTYKVREIKALGGQYVIKFFGDQIFSGVQANWWYKDALPAHKAALLGSGYRCL